MRILGPILIVSLALAAFKAALAVLMASYMVLIVVLVLVRPKEAFGLLVFFVLSGLLRDHAVATLASFVALCVLGAVIKSFKMTPF